MTEISSSNGSTFSQEDLVKFGNFLLSSQRTLSIKTNPRNDLPSDRLYEVSDADVANWLGQETSPSAAGNP